MDNKEARSILKKWKNIGKKGMTEERLGYIEGWFHKEDVEAFNMGIEALMHTPCYLDSPCEYQNPDIKIPKHQCIVWHPYAKVKPNEDKIYLVTYHYVDCNGKPTDATTYAEFKKGHFHNVPRVTAWTELLEPYRKEGAKE